MRCIYEIRYEQQWESCEPSQWLEQTVRVLADEDAQQAVDRAGKRPWRTTAWTTMAARASARDSVCAACRWSPRPIFRLWLCGPPGQPASQRRRATEIARAAYTARAMSVCRSLMPLKRWWPGFAPLCERLGKVRHVP